VPNSENTFHHHIYWTIKYVRYFSIDWMWNGQGQEIKEEDNNKPDNMRGSIPS